MRGLRYDPYWPLSLSHDYRTFKETNSEFFRPRVVLGFYSVSSFHVDIRILTDFGFLLRSEITCVFWSCFKIIQAAVFLEEKDLEPSLKKLTIMPDQTNKSRPLLPPFPS